MVRKAGGAPRPAADPSEPSSPTGPPGSEVGDEAGKRRSIVLYVAFIGGGLVLLQLLLWAGHGVHAPRPAAGPRRTVASTEDIVWRILLAASVIIVVARGVGSLFRRINQPQVVGEIVAGVLLGPSALGLISHPATMFLFPDKVLPYIDAMAQIGLVFFMFLIGLELDVKLIRGRGHVAATVSHASIIFPFLLGTGVALILFPVVGSGAGKFTPFALFLGASMSITAFPVLARILTERGIYKTHLGAVTLTCAAVDDVTAWCILAVVVAVARSHGPEKVLITIGLAIVFIAVMILLVRPLVARVASYHEERGQLAGGMLALLFVGVLLSALATDRIGIHAIFGAFLFGAIMPQRSELIAELTGKLEDFTVVFFLPLFFAFSGLRTDLTLLGGDGRLWLFCLLILAVAIAGKWGGSTLTARIVGLPMREAMGVGVLMNTRGLTELIILNIGLELGVIPPTLFAMLVVMALVTTFMTTPILALVYGHGQLERMVDEAGGADEEEDRAFRILVPVASPGQAAELVHTAIRLAREYEERAHIDLLRVVQLPGSAYRAGPRTERTITERAMRNLRPLIQLIEGAGIEATPIVVPSSHPGETVVRVARERHADVILAGWHRSLFGHRLLGGTVGHILRHAASDVAVLVDPAHKGLSLKRDGTIVVAHGGGFHEEVGLDLALRLAEASHANVTLLGPAGEEAASEQAQRAAEAYETTGVWTTPVPVEGDVTTALVAAARGADLVVLGVSDEWVRNREVGALREAVAARTPTPILLVRRHGQRGSHRWLRRHREWMDRGENGGPEVISVDGAAPLEARERT